jgi:Sec-independent protein translocase protein TatA|tara:strand:+ start:218 stop:394 length:177 start_codon:yes stop_codon:yes gene_type:complete
LNFVPSKDQKKKEIPEAMRNIAEVIRQFKRATGADDRYVVLILAAMMADYQEKTSPWK